VTVFSSADGTRLAYHVVGEGEPLICLPGGPMMSSAYLGDLGGLSEQRSLVRLGLRGTGESDEPADPMSYRCDRQVDDVEALRTQLGRERIDLVAHSAGGTLTVLYAARYPGRVDHLVLVTPSPRVVGVEIADIDR
jgi:pimeloyl-ACP methyl ester carboxylesterase